MLERIQGKKILSKKAPLSLVRSPKLAKIVNWITLTTYSMHRKEKMNGEKKGRRKES